MELTGELKDKVSKCETKEQVKEQIKNAGMILTDEELDNVAGGYFMKMNAAMRAMEKRGGTFR